MYSPLLNHVLHIQTSNLKRQRLKREEGTKGQLLILFTF